MLQRRCIAGLRRLPHCYRVGAGAVHADHPKISRGVDRFRGNAFIARHHCDTMPGFPCQGGGTGSGRHARAQAGAGQSLDTGWMDWLNNQAISGDHIGRIFKHVWVG